MALVQNKKARHDFEILEEMEAGPAPKIAFVGGIAFFPLVLHFVLPALSNIPFRVPTQKRQSWFMGEQ